MTEKQTLLEVREREFTTTLKVLRAFPKNKESFKPHERSRSAGELAFTLAIEEMINVQAAEGVVDFQKLSQDMPKTMDEIIFWLEKNHAEATQAITATSEEDINKTLKFGTMNLRRIDVMWFMLFDTIHHRGQFSVYIRMAGGKVPSIYGPSADDPGDM